MEGEKLYIEVAGEKRFVGTLFGKTLVVERDKNKHLLRKWNAYGINATHIDSGIAETVVLKDNDGNWMIPVENVKAFGRLSTEGDFEKQYFIELKHFIKI